MIIIPDIHGRSFWKSAVKQVKEEEKIIFLGDYLDPYPTEGISVAEAIINFEEIIDYAKEHDNVILLLGNHDIHYFNDNLNGSRKNFIKASDIKAIFEKNTDLFSIIYTEGDYLFSHAGFLPGWLEKRYPGMSISEVLEKIKEDFKSMTLYEFSKHIWDVSYYRGGWTNFGSFIWADANEHIEIDIIDYYQIFGHTQLKKEYIGHYFACLDRRDAFRLENKELKRITFEDYYENKETI